MDTSRVKSVLDFGGDKGQFIPDEFCTAQKYVCDLSHKDPVEGVRAISDLRESQHIKFDFIICSHVLEHVPYPNQILNDLKTFSHTNTMFYFEVPIDLFTSKHVIGRMMNHISPKFFNLFIQLRNVIKRRPFCFFMHEHINHFRISSMNNMLRLQGFEVKFIGTKRFDFPWIKNLEILSCLAKLQNIKQ